MKSKKSELKDILTYDYFIKYGYFLFKKKIIEYSEYPISSVFSKDIWNMEDFFNFFLANKEKITALLSSSKNMITDPIKINQFKNEYNKRQHKIINFYNYLRITMHLIENKSEYESLFLEDTHSLSKHFLSSFSENNIKKKKNINFKGKQYILKTDISNFYHSLYTHSIPWVFLSKKYAKNEKQEDNFPNKLDRYIRESQSGETKGIPVGHFTSRFIAEIFQLKLDQRLSEKGYFFSRYVDDYSFFIEEMSEKNEILTTFHNIYSEIELHINDSKTVIVKYPDNSSQFYQLENHFNAYSGKIKSILESSEREYLKSNKLAKIVYSYIDLYYQIKNSNEIKGPIFYFELNNFLEKVKEASFTVYENLLYKTDILFEITNIYILELKYTDYFIKFLDIFEYKKERIKIEKTFKKYEKLFQKKINMFSNRQLDIELSHILTLNLLYPYFIIPKSKLYEILEQKDSINSMLAFKILMNNNASINSILKSINKRIMFKYAPENSYFSFSNDDFIFSYEIIRLYKYDSNFKHAVNKNNGRLSREINFFLTLGKIDNIQNFYKFLLNNNISFLHI